VPEGVPPVIAEPVPPPKSGLSTTAIVLIVLACLIPVFCAVGLPVVIFCLKVGWPRVRQRFSTGIEDLQDSDDAPRPAKRGPSKPSR
jgi:hypothetical protein